MHAIGEILMTGADVLWRNALLLVPLTLVVGLVARAMTWRPGTRHVLWLSVLLWLGLGPFLPAPPQWRGRTGEAPSALPPNVTIDLDSPSTDLLPAVPVDDSQELPVGVPLPDLGVEAEAVVELELIEPCNAEYGAGGDGDWEAAVGPLLAWLASPLPAVTMQEYIAGPRAPRGILPQSETSIAAGQPAMSRHSDQQAARTDAMNQEPLAQASASAGPLHSTPDRAPVMAPTYPQNLASDVDPSTAIAGPVAVAAPPLRESPTDAAVVSTPGSSIAREKTWAREAERTAEPPRFISPPKSALAGGGDGGAKRMNNDAPASPARLGSAGALATGDADVDVTAAGRAEPGSSDGPVNKLKDIAFSALDRSWSAVKALVRAGALSLVGMAEAQAAPWIDASSRLWNDLALLPAIPLPVWGAGILAWFMWQVWMGRRFRKFLHEGEPAASDVAALVRGVAARMGLRRVPRVLFVDARVSPMIWPGRRPVLILPLELWNQYDPVARRAVVCHELAHLYRRDHWVLWFEQLVGCLYWWHPLVWWVRRRLHEEMETCCDLWVTWLMPEGRKTYAQALLQTRQYLSTEQRTVYRTDLGVFTGRARRIARRLTMVMTQRVRPGASLPGVLLALALGGGAWLLAPAQLAAQEGRATAPKASGGVPFATATMSGEEEAEGTPAPAVLGAGAGYSTGAVADGRDEGRGAGRPRAPRARAEAGGRRENLEERIDQLEEQLARLTEQLEMMSHAIGAPEGTPVPPTPPAPPAPPVPPTPSAPRAPRAGDSPFPTPPAAPRGWVQPGTPAPGPGPQAVFAGPSMERSYRLDGDKLKALTELMVRDDVPVKVRPGSDEIVVLGDEGVQSRFDAFVRMIDTNETAWQEYRLSEGKLEALTELMSRSDVPVLVAPTEGGIRVQGTPLQQLVFAEFLGLLESSPRGERGTIRRIGSAGGQNKAAQGLREQVKKELKEKQKEGKKEESKHKAEIEAKIAQAYAHAGKASKADVERDLAAAMAGAHGDLRAEIAAALQAVPMAAESEAAHADAVRAYELLAAHAMQPNRAEWRKAVRDAVRAQAKGKGWNRAPIELQIRALMESSRALEQRARELEKKAEQLEHEAELLDERAEQVNEQAEEMRERAGSTGSDDERSVLDRELQEMDEMVATCQERRSVLGQEMESITKQAVAVYAQAEGLSELAEVFEDAVEEIDEADDEADADDGADHEHGHKHGDASGAGCPTALQECQHTASQPCPDDCRLTWQKRQ